MPDNKNPEKQLLYKRFAMEHHPNTMFSPSDRLKLVISILEAPVEAKGCGLRE